MLNRQSTDLRQKVGNAVLVRVVQGGVANHAPVVYELSYRFIQLLESGAGAPVEVLQEKPGVRLQKYVQRPLQKDHFSHCCNDGLKDDEDFMAIKRQTLI